MKISTGAGGNNRRDNNMGFLLLSYYIIATIFFSEPSIHAKYINKSHVLQEVCFGKCDFVKINNKILYFRQQYRFDECGWATRILCLLKFEEVSACL